MNYIKHSITLCILSLAVILCHADLIVTPCTPKTTGNKTVVTLGLKNTFTQPIESARAILFLLDEKGEMVGQSTKWVIGGSQNRPGLAAGATNVFNFVITSAEPLTSTNLTAKVSFTRVVLEGGKLANPNTVITAEQQKK
jgi:hypothetical protein